MGGYKGWLFFILYDVFLIVLMILVKFIMNEDLIIVLGLFIFLSGGIYI